MAKKIVVDLEAKTDKAVKEIADLKKEIQKLNKEVAEGNKDTKQGLQDVEKASDKTAGGVKKISSALKALGIGLIVAAFAKFTEVLNQNQKVADFFSTTFETLSLAFNDFFNFIFDNVGGVVNAFKSIFNDPVESIKSFGKAIVNNIVERFKSAIDAIGFLGTAIKKVFEGDFAGAAESAKNAGKELFDVVTGVDDSFDKTVETVTKVAEATTNYVKETVNAAQANVELGKQAEIARVRQQGIIESFDRQAEKLRQVRDDERNTINDRIAANNRLKETLDEQEEAMLKQVDLQIAAAQAEFDKNQNQENTIALLEAQQEKQAVLAQIEGFRSEQKSNEAALERELLDLNQSNIDAKVERANAERDFNAEQIENEQLRLQTQLDNLEKEKQAEIERLENKKKLYKEGTQAFADADNELKAYQQEAGNREIEIDRKLAKAKEQNITNALGSIANIVGQNSKFGKGIAIVQAIRDTFAGANKALASAPPPFNFIQAAAVVASGIANVKTITSTPEPSPPSFAKGGGGGAGTAIPTPSAPPAFNVVGASGVNQLATAIGQQQQQPVKAFVVSNDVSTAQELDRNIVQGAAIG
jgi:uncharacterized protein YhaN